MRRRGVRIDRRRGPRSDSTARQATRKWPDGISVTLHAAGIRSLVAELAGQEAPTLAGSEPLLEAAE